MKEQLNAVDIGSELQPEFKIEPDTDHDNADTEAEIAYDMVDDAGLECQSQIKIEPDMGFE